LEVKMTDKTTPAFPVSALVYNYDDKAPDTILHDGMTLRDYFAAKAMEGFIAYATQKGIYVPPDDELASTSYQLADAMMKARNQ